MKKIYVLVDETVGVSGSKFNYIRVGDLDFIGKFYGVNAKSIKSLVKSLNKKYGVMYSGCSRAYRLLNTFESNFSQKQLELLNGKVYEINDLNNIDSLLSYELSK